MGLSHAPPYRLALTPWMRLGLTLEVQDLLLWMRLPNVLLSGGVMLLFIHIGRNIGVLAVGFGAAAIFGLAPVLVQFSSCQSYYFLEIVTATWFLERLTAYIEGGRPVHRTLALSAALAVWTGYMAIPLLIVGAVAYLAVAWRRGETRSALAGGLLLLAMTAPILPLMLETALFYTRLS